MRQGWDPRTLFILALAIFIVPGLLSQNRRQPDGETIIAFLISGVIAITVHEFMHAFSAWKLGDDTAYRMDRVNLNPINHFDPLGFFGFVLISLGFTSIAWGKPVPVAFNRLKGDFKRRKMASLIIAGCAPLSNFVMAILAAALLGILDRPNVDLAFTGTLLSAFIQMNVLLAAFNLIPIPPLDGYRALSALLPNFWFPVFAKTEQFGLFLPFALIFVDRQFDLGIYGALISPGFNAMWSVVLDVVALF